MTENKTASNEKLLVHLPFVGLDSCKKAYSGIKTLIDEQVSLTKTVTAIFFFNFFFS